MNFYNVVFELHLFEVRKIWKFWKIPKSWKIFDFRPSAFVNKNCENGWFSARIKKRSLVYTIYSKNESWVKLTIFFDFLVTACPTNFLKEKFKTILIFQVFWTQNHWKTSILGGFSYQKQSKIELEIFFKIKLLPNSWKHNLCI